MLKKLLLFSLAVLFTATASADGKEHYIPNEWKNFNSSDTLLYSKTDASNKYTWSELRSRETDNFIVYWDKYYGNTAPDQLSTSDYYYVDIDYLLKKAEEYYKLECDMLGFVDPETSNIRKYKIMILMNHTQTWTCYGAGYDFQVPALWLNPATCKPVGSAVAHEVGHSFHYMCYSEDSEYGTKSGIWTGFHGPVGQGATIWETTANWQALQSFPDEIMTESYHYAVFNKTHNYAFTHEWHRYQAYMFLYYLCQKYNDIRTVADVWNYRETLVKDFNQVLMDLKGLSAKELYALHFEFAMRAVTWDLDSCVKYRDGYIGNFEYNKINLGNSKYQVAYSSCPQGTGFNVIPLNVPDAGTTITTHLTGLTPGCELADGDPGQYIDGNTTLAKAGVTTYNDNSAKTARGFRLGYVMLMKNGDRKYVYTDSVYCQGKEVLTEDFQCEVPEGVDRMWLVVAPSLKRYQQHKWDENIKNDDQWPYQVQFENTDIYGEPTIDGRAIADATITWDVNLKPSKEYFDGASIYTKGEAMAAMGTAFQLTTDEISTKLMTWDERGPSTDRIMFYPANADGTLQQIGSTANGYGHWFDKEGTAVSYSSASSSVYSQLATGNYSFLVGQYPNRCSDGEKMTIRQALYLKGRRNTSATVYFVFNINFSDSATNSAKLASISTNSVSGIQNVYFPQAENKIYNLQGQEVENPGKGLYIVNGRKVIL